MDKKYNITNMSLKKLLKLSFLMNLIQLLLIITVITYAARHPSKDIYLLIYLSAALTAFNSTLTALGYYLILYNKENSMLDTINNLEMLNSKLREQRHDYLNHIQVVYGLIELEEIEEAKRYIQPVYNDILRVSKALRTAHPAVNALLQAKVQMAEKANINVHLEVKTDLGRINIEPWELCKVLSNVIDNGIRALKENKACRNLYIDIKDELEGYRIAIYNNGPMIQVSNLEMIFKEGFTTKKDEGHGIGLFIVKDILEKVGGSIEVKSNHDKTYFYIYLPKQ